MLKFVNQVSSLASQERSEGGLQPDGDASKGPPTTQAQQKKRTILIVLYILSEMVKEKKKEHKIKCFLSSVL